jgi:hypothetical protein
MILVKNQAGSKVCPVLFSNFIIAVANLSCSSSSGNRNNNELQKMRDELQRIQRC